MKLYVITIDVKSYFWFYEIHTICIPPFFIEQERIMEMLRDVYLTNIYHYLLYRYIYNNSL